MEYKIMVSVALSINLIQRPMWTASAVHFLLHFKAEGATLDRTFSFSSSFE
jgi:hypothetical protein